MGRITIISRPVPNSLPGIRLPFHVRSAGANESLRTWSESFAPDKKPFVQIFWTRRGMGEVLLHGERIRLREGDFFYHLPGDEHRHRTIGEIWNYNWFTLDGAGSADFVRAYGYEQKARYAGECPVKLFTELELLLEERTPYAQRHAIAVAAEILALAGGPFHAAVQDDPVRNFMTLAQENLSCEKLTAENLAAELGIHRTTLNRLVRARTGMSPGKYLRELRISHLLALLRETALPVKSVAAECGIPYAGYLCRIVRERTGLTPEGYREQEKFRTRNAEFRTNSADGTDAETHR